MKPPPKGWVKADAVRIVTRGGVSEVQIRHNGGRPAAAVSDRALRYRAHANAPELTRCVFCGAAKSAGGRKLDLAHVNGFEEDNDSANLVWSCRACNVQCGRVFAEAGQGRKTKQFNPGRRAAASGGAKSLGEWLDATATMRGHETGSMRLPDAIRVVRNTSAARRKRFAEQIWSNRRENPGARDLREWKAVVSLMRELPRGSAKQTAAWKVVDATPKRLRSEWNKEIWAERLGGSVPF